MYKYKHYWVLTLLMMFDISNGKSLAYPDKTKCECDSIVERNVFDSLNANIPITCFYPYKGLKIEGIVQCYYSSRKIYCKSIFSNNIEVGPYETFYENGKQRSKVIFRFPNITEQVIYYPNGRIKVEGVDSLCMNSKHICTLQKSYYESGNIEEMNEYIDQIPNGLHIGYRDTSGVVIYDAKMKNGKIEGQTKYYYPNGSLEYIRNYINGVQEGIERSFYESGEIWEEVLFANDFKNGYRHVFNQSGQLIGEAEYLNDQTNSWNNYNSESGELESTEELDNEFCTISNANGKITYRGLKNEEHCHDLSVLDIKSDRYVGKGGQDGNWEYLTENDPLRGVQRKWATCVSNEEKDVGLHYSKSKQKIIIRFRQEDNLQILLSINPGVYSCENMLCRISVKFDNGPIEIYSLKPSFDSGLSIIFFNNQKQILKKIQNSKKILIESNFYLVGTESFTFNTKGLIWKQ